MFLLVKSVRAVFLQTLERKTAVLLFSSLIFCHSYSFIGFSPHTLATAAGPDRLGPLVGWIVDLYHLVIIQI